jgi:hypothetical protein
MVHIDAVAMMFCNDHHCAQADSMVVELTVTFQILTMFIPWRRLPGVGMVSDRILHVV